MCWLAAYNRIDELLVHRWSAAWSRSIASNLPLTKNIEALIADGGDLSLGATPPFECTATDGNGHNRLTMRVRRESESLQALLKRFDKAIGIEWSDDLPIAEVNDARSDSI